MQKQKQNQENQDDFLAYSDVPPLSPFHPKFCALAHTPSLIPDP